MRVAQIVWILALLVGCDDDVDLSGIYRVDVEVASRPCGNDQPVAMPAPFVRLTRSELFGNEYFAYDSCTDEAGTDCASVGGLFGGFFEPIDGGWLGRTSFASNTGLNCSLGVTESTAIVNSSQLVIESSTYEERLEIAEDMCTPDEAERRGDTMPCTQHDRIDATKL